MDSTVGLPGDDGLIIPDPDIAALEAQGMEEQWIREFVLGRGLGCRRALQGRDLGLTSETPRDRVQEVE